MIGAYSGLPLLSPELPIKNMRIGQPPTAARAEVLAPQSVIPASVVDNPALVTEVLQFAWKVPGRAAAIKRGELTHDDAKRAIVLAQRVLPNLAPHVIVNRRVEDVLHFLAANASLRTGFDTGRFASADRNDVAALAWRSAAEQSLFRGHRSETSLHPIYGTVQFSSELVGDPTQPSRRWDPPVSNIGVPAYGRVALVLDNIERLTTVTPTDSSKAESNDVTPFSMLFLAIAKRLVSDEYAIGELHRIGPGKQEEFLSAYLRSTAMTDYMNNWITYIEAQVHGMVVPKMVREIRLNLRGLPSFEERQPHRSDVERLRQLSESHGIKFSEVRP